VGEGDFIEEAIAALLISLAGVGTMEWYRMPTTSLVVEFLMRQEANSNRSSHISELICRNG
jgi:hypothetical protein